MKEEFVRSWMKREVVKITPDATLHDAHQLMVENNIRRLPVLKDDQLVGIVTLGDIREAAPSDVSSLSERELNLKLDEVAVEAMMTKNPVTIGPDSTIVEVAWTMMDYKISGLPVINSVGSVIGMITESDIFRMVVQGWGKPEKLTAKQIAQIQG